MSRNHTARKVSFYAGWQEYCAAFDCPVDTMLSTVGLPAEVAEQEHPELTTDQFFRFWKALQGDKSTREMTERMLGFFHQVMPAPYLAALCSRNLRTALTHMVKFKRILSPKPMSLVSVEEGLCVVCDWHSPNAPDSMYFVNLCVLRLLAEKGTGRTVLPLKAECPGADQFPDDLAKDFLGVSLEPGPVSKLIFSRADSEAEFKTTNQVTLRILENSLQQRLMTASEQSVEQVKFALKRLLPDQRHSIEEVAAELGCSARTLQRRLFEEGTNFREVCDQTRCDLACFYLRKARFSPKETSFLLGYSEPASFYHAFRRWTDQSPSAFAGKDSPSLLTTP
jgi:AraC-like DNA-binding protein